MNAPDRPNTLAGWLLFLWAVGGTFAVLVDAIVRLTPQALALFHDPRPIPVTAALLWSVFMVGVEGWRGFHQRFNPRVVVRAMLLTQRPWWSALAGPIVVMGLLDATRRRLIANWALVFGIVLLVIGVQQLPDVWRSVVDLGVVLGLSFGAVSLAGYTIAAVLGRPPEVAPEFPKEADAPAARNQ